MKVRILNAGGHTELDVSVEEAIAAIEKAMNEAPRSILVEEKAGQETVRVATPEDLKDYAEAEAVWVIPQFVGG